MPPAGAVAPDAGEIKSLAAILGRVANPVEPFDFVFVQDALSLSFFGGVRDASGTHRKFGS
jgi:hypothetical protein